MIFIAKRWIAVSSIAALLTIVGLTPARADWDDWHYRWEHRWHRYHRHIYYHVTYSPYVEYYPATYYPVAYSPYRWHHRYWHRRYYDRRRHHWVLSCGWLFQSKCPERRGLDSPESRPRFTEKDMSLYVFSSMSGSGGESISCFF